MLTAKPRSFPVRAFALVLLLAAATAYAACGGDNGTDQSTFPSDASAGDDGTGDDGSQGDGGVTFGDGGDGQATADGPNNCVAPTSLALTPATTTANVNVGTPFSQAYTVTATYANNATSDVTTASFFSISDPHVGTFNASTFNWGGVYGGTFKVSARHCGVIGTAALTLDLHVVVGSGSDGGVVDAGGASTTFGNAPPSNVSACAPTLVYPPDGVLIPPNTNVIEVHFLEGSPSNTIFEISFENAVTDVKVYTTCSGTTAAAGMPLNGGCVFELSQSEWDYIAQTNRDGDPVTVKVRGLGCDGGNVASSATRQISFAKEDMVGALYYWASMRITQGGQNYNSGGVFRYDYGVRGQSPYPVLTPNTGANSTGLCIGCHTVSRDGRQMIFDFDDNDDDDEYSDVRTDIWDIAAAHPVEPIVKNGVNDFPPGYHTWDRTTKQFLLSDGPGNSATPAGALRRVSVAGSTLGYTQPGSLRATTPDWAPDNSTVVFAAPPNVSAAPPNGAGFWGTGRDLWFAGASLYTAAYDANTSLLGAPTLLLASSNGDNFYYPSYSPDKSFIAFNHATSGANFHNTLARVQLVVAGQANPTPDDLVKLNKSDNPVDLPSLTNSWARWAPFVQSYKGGKILWLTMSSTRSYGLRVINDTTKVNCYPRESPLTTPIFSSTSNCTRAQLWFAAIKLDTNGVVQGTDVSYPAFWLPFQDLTTNNHLAQWAERSFTGTCGRGADAGAEAGADAGTCAPGLCCDNGGCTTCPNPPPPPATCSSNANCTTGQCCNAGTCGACGTSDAGGPPPVPCQTCLDCNGQACNGNACGGCASSSDCCAPLLCQNGQCVPPPR